MKTKIIELPQFLDPRGNLSVIEECDRLPFKIQRVHWIYDVPGGGLRNGHAYYNNQEFIIALSGSFDVITHDGINCESITLNRTYKGLYIPQMTWRELSNFTTNSVALVLSSMPYDEADYINEFELFKKLKNE